VNGAVEALAGERFLMDRAIGIAVEEAADAVLKLDDSVGRIVHEGPGELLVVEELAAFDRVVEMLVEGISRVENAVVTALHHPRATGLADEAFHGDDDAGGRISGRDVKRGEHACTAGSEDEHVAGELIYW
jgi:hypothetical protein